MLPALAAVVWHGAHGPAGPALLAVSVAEAAPALVVAWQVIAYADLRRDEQDSGSGATMPAAPAPRRS